MRQCDNDTHKKIHYGFNSLICTFVITIRNMTGATCEAKSTNETHESCNSVFGWFVYAHFLFFYEVFCVFSFFAIAFQMFFYLCILVVRSVSSASL